MEKNTFTNAFYTFDYLYKSNEYIAWHENNTASFKKYREDWIRRPQERNFDNFPLTLNLEITRKCNLACTFCWHKDLEKVKNIIWI